MVFSVEGNHYKSESVSIAILWLLLTPEVGVNRHGHSIMACTLDSGGTRGLNYCTLRFPDQCSGYFLPGIIATVEHGSLVLGYSI